ncbi:MAG: stage II sporulation protein R [Oscillospiraceae bacterium]|nr:stage II sporulation protein R [Oscillospiraceae bacterium]
MKKLIKILACMILLLSTVWMADVWQDKKVLQENLIRLHVVANSDSSEDQDIKLQVKDAVVGYLQPFVKDFANKKQAMEFVADNLSSIQQVANAVLQEQGKEDRAAVYLGSETFDTRHYETFSLPAGVYDSLRIQIGEGNGKNWWCVVFPSLCLPATSDGFQDTAVSAGFSDELGNSLAGGKNFRFFILDCFGKIERLFN